MRKFNLSASLYRIGLVGAVLATVACQCSSEPRRPVNEIKSLLSDLVLAAEARSVDEVCKFLKDDFQGDGRFLGGSKQNLRRGLQVLFLRRSQVYVLPHVRHIEVNAEHTEASLIVWMLITRTRIDFDALDLDLRGDVLEVSASLKYDDVWRVSNARWKRIPLARMIAEKLVD